MRVAATTSYFDAGGPRAATQTKSQSKRVSVSITHPIIRQRKTTLWVELGIEGRNFEEQRLGQERFNDKLRSVYATSTLRKAHLNGISSLSATVTQGVNILNASVGGALSRADATNEFTKFGAELSRLQRLNKNISVYVNVSGQLSLDPLLSSEEFSLGGARYGRAYDYGEFKGDDGVATYTEIRYGGKTNLDFLKSYQFFGYYDFGAVWNDNVAAQYEMLNLSSTGGGLRLTFENDVRLNAELVKPLDGIPATQSDQSWRGFFNLSKTF